LLNYTELRHDGYWNVKGGMYRIVEALMHLLLDHGVTFNFNTEVVRVNTANGKVSEVIDAYGKVYTGDVVVVNADAAAFRGQFLQRTAFRPEKLDRMVWTLAPFTIYIGMKGKLPDAVYHHNYFLGSNFEEYAHKIFKTDVAPRKPYYYVNVASKSNADQAPEGCENIFILCPVPDRRYKPEWPDADQLADDIIRDFGERVGYDVAGNILTKTVYTPLDWEGMFNLYKGSGLGLAHGMMQVGGLRPANKDEQLGNLYYVGASTVPGTGLPIVVIGSKLVTERILNDHGALS
jgi:phytoene desaturase